MAFFTAMSRPPTSEVAETGAVHGDQAVETVRRFVAELMPNQGFPADLSKFVLSSWHFRSPFEPIPRVAASLHRERTRAIVLMITNQLLA